MSFQNHRILVVIAQLLDKTTIQRSLLHVSAVISDALTHVHEKV